MIKYLIFAILIGFSSQSIAECSELQKKSGFDIKTILISNGVKAGGNHGYMDVINISVPLDILGVPFQSIELTYGEVSAYWIPLATQIEDGRIIGSLSGYKDSIYQFEFSVTYENDSCILFEAGAISTAYNKPLKQDK